jgi:hypothetical protein
MIKRANPISDYTSPRANRLTMGPKQLETNRREGLTNAAPAVAKAVRWGHVGNGGTRNIEPVFPTRVRNMKLAK